MLRTHPDVESEFSKEQLTTCDLSVSQLRSNYTGRSDVTVRLIQFAKVITHRRQTERLGKSVAMLGERVDQEAPKFFALAINHTQLHHDAHQRCRAIH